MTTPARMTCDSCGALEAVDVEYLMCCPVCGRLFCPTCYGGSILSRESDPCRECRPRGKQARRVRVPRKGEVDRG